MKKVKPANIVTLLLVVFFIGDIFALAWMLGREVGRKEHEEIHPIVEHIRNTRGDIIVESKPAIDEYRTRFMDEFYQVDCKLPVEQQQYLYMLCKDYNIHYPLALALIDVESKFEPNIVSSTDDYGLMQINSVNHDYFRKYLGVTDFLDPYQNMQCGMSVLHGLFEKYGNNPHTVLMAYNMGEGGATEMLNSGFTSSNYSRKVLDTMKKYERSNKHE